jgi:DNA-binding Xre family transcriptional regulator
MMADSKRFRWRLAERMHERGIHQVTGLQRSLAAHGIDMSVSQVHRLVTQTPERLNLEVLAALCEILACTPADLVVLTAPQRQRVVATGDNVVEIAEAVRPRRARVTRPPDEQ